MTEIFSNKNIILQQLHILNDEVMKEDTFIAHQVDKILHTLSFNQDKNIVISLIVDMYNILEDIEYFNPVLFNKINIQLANLQEAM